MARPDDGSLITFVYGSRAVQGCARRRHGSWDDAGWFMAESDTTTPRSEFVEYEGITWEHGWTDGQALLAAHALMQST